MVALKNLRQTYPKGVHIRFKDWTLNQGEHWLMLGGSGSGKTTLLHIISGLLKPQEGEIFFGGQSMYGMSESRRDHFRGRNIGIVFQQPHLLKSLSVIDNLLLAQSLAGYAVNKAYAEELLDRLNISAKKDSKISQLSQGQAQRVAIARAVINRPKLLIADEPTSSLDDKNCGDVLDLLISQAAENESSLVIATHDGRVKKRFSNQYLLNEHATT